ncbi:dynein regulatory complex subunit 3 isoform X2 [Amblyraja radiata]|uniref:dynein regulatory complex subunit 3 isoform X2 n=1 Tax=Amblyraja radiata TaxID=386614 RepID=UPI001402EE5E|nr:dynein regulatory complex subunit 3 isoform X2 [Amblyraja radiata]
MSQPYKTIEPSVIDDKMLEEMVKKQGPSGRAGQIAQQEGIDFKDVDHLQLDFQNILKIDNMWQFTSLTKLQLDNNVIEKIEGLNTLSNLIWLDLSFNNIEMIEGLDELVKLEDLSLYNNRISKFENMDSLVNLQIFSIGKNHISDLESVVYLRRFKRLRTLNLAGNPVSESERYSLYIPAFLPNLMYLDFRLIDKLTKELALQMHNSAIAYLVHQEGLEFKSLERMRLEEEELALHQALNEMQHISDSVLMESKTRYLRGKINRLWSKLMSLEMQLVDQLEEASREFERNISEMVSTYIENVQALIAQCRDLENRNHENMLEIAMSSYDKMGKTEGDEEMPEELRALFIDKDTVINTVNASHDLHLLKIDNQEDKMVTKSNAWVRDVLEKLHTDEIARNRKRVLEINIYVSHWRDELDFLDIQDT